MPRRNSRPGTPVSELSNSRAPAGWTPIPAPVAARPVNPRADGDPGPARTADPCADGDPSPTRLPDPRADRVPKPARADGDPNPALAAALDGFDSHLRDQRGLSAHTARAYLADVRAIAAGAAAAGRPAPPDWDAALLRGVLAGAARNGGRGGRLGPASLARRQSALRTFLAWHRRCRGEAGPCPVAACLEAPRAPRRLPRPLTAEAALALVAAAPAAAPRGGARRNQAALVLLFGLGLRVAEVAALRRTDVDLAGARVRVRGKGGKTRVVPLPAATLPLLRAYGAELPADRGTFLTGRGGRPLSIRTLRRAVAAAAGAGIGRHIAPHQLRHTYASELLASGAGLRHIQRLLGHRSLVTTQRYTRVAPEHLLAAYDAAHPRARGP